MGFPAMRLHHRFAPSGALLPLQRTRPCRSGGMDKRSRSSASKRTTIVKEYGMDRSQKADAVAQLSEVFAQSGVVVVTRNLGLSVEQSTELRSKMREAGATYKVAKNRLAKLALKDTDYAGLDEYLTGPTALGYSEDPVAAAKAVVEFAKTTDKIEIVGGSMGAQKLDEAGVKALAATPSLDELRGTIVGLVNAPATKVV